MNDQSVTSFAVAAGVTRISEYAYHRCRNLASLGGMREGVTNIERYAFANCRLLTTLRGLPESLEAVHRGAFESTRLSSLDGLPPAVTHIGYRAFGCCFYLTSIGPGFSPGCDVHRKAFYNCPALETAARAKGFGDPCHRCPIIEWGRRHWLAVNCRFPVLCAVSRARRDGFGEGSPLEGSPLLKNIAFLCGDLVREVLEFVGAGGVEE